MNLNSLFNSNLKGGRATPHVIRGGSIIDHVISTHLNMANFDLVSWFTYSVRSVDILSTEYGRKQYWLLGVSVSVSSERLE